MKKHFFTLVVLCTIALGLSSCGAVGMMGAFYMGQTTPEAVTSNVVGTKVGVVKCTNLFNLASFGDASINKAAKMAGITKISHVDVKTTSVLTIFCTKTYYVYGE